MREQSFELRENRLDRHLANLHELTGGTLQRNPPGGSPRTLSRAPRPRSRATARAAPPPRRQPVPPPCRTAPRT
ncbi:hypothetical protein D9753_23680 [Streptomyces dangxiongensis]|uniref:Uncharacterized protein n=1 Tax=Streptomyces dangxiongensis TaxID=1442032 RepID=A0A3G2JGI7_9ACTN|nr:hypothetical protein D9753_23680 [Streptomyces dangxiongensis]